MKRILIITNLLATLVCSAQTHYENPEDAITNPFHKQLTLDYLYMDGKKYVLSESPVKQLDDQEAIQKLYYKEYHCLLRTNYPYAQDKEFRCVWTIADNTIMMSDIYIIGKSLSEKGNGRPDKKELKAFEKIAKEKATTKWNARLANAVHTVNPLGVIEGTWIDSIDIREADYYELHTAMPALKRELTPYRRLYFSKGKLIGEKEIKPELKIANVFFDDTKEQMSVIYNGEYYYAPGNLLKERMGEAYTQCMNTFNCRYGIVDGYLVAYILPDRKAGDEPLKDVPQTVYDEIEKSTGSKFTTQWNDKVVAQKLINQAHPVLKHGVLPLATVDRLDIKSMSYQDELFLDKISYNDFIMAPYLRLHFVNGKVDRQETITPKNLK